MGKRKGRCTKKNSVTKESAEPEHLVKAPHSFVIHRGNCSKDIVDLTKDFREIMEPFTASQLKVRLDSKISFALLEPLVIQPSKICCRKKCR